MSSGVPCDLGLLRRGARLTLRGIYVFPRTNDTEVALLDYQDGIVPAGSPADGYLDGHGHNLAAEALSPTMFAHYRPTR